jgi:RNA-directed DNA polymerase
LHGLEEAAGVRYLTSGINAGDVRRDSPVLIRYADLCRTRHKSAYAEYRVMPTVVVNVQVGDVAGVGWSA